MHRNIQRLVIALLWFATMSTGNTQQVQNSRINLFKDAVEAVGAAGDAIAKITDGIRHLVVTGAEGYNYVAAERERDRLKRLSARATNLGSVKQQIVVRSIDEYLKKSNPSQADWDAVTDGIRNVIIGVKGLLDDVRNERSDFVLEESYSKFVSTLGSRALLLDKLENLPAPSTTEERAALAQINIEYKRLLTNFQEAITQLNAYLKQKKPT